MTQRFGLSAALLTPYDAVGAVDAPRLAQHADALLRAGADGVTPLGTTGEGASIGLNERRGVLAALGARGIEPGRITWGVAASSAEEALTQVAQGVEAGVTRFLLPPPFYFSAPSEAGLFDWHADLFAAAPPKARFVLYHIPQVTGAPLPPRLAGRLLSAFPERVAAIKDSSGDWGNAEALMAIDGLPVVIGDERLLHRAAAQGAAGAISGMANLHPARLARVLGDAREDAGLSAQTDAVVAHPVVPALKALMAARSGDAAWDRVRPPLMPLADDARAALLATAREAA